MNFLHRIILAAVGCSLLLSACQPSRAVPMPVAPSGTAPAPSPTSTSLPPAILIHEDLRCLTTPQEGGELVATFHSGDTVPVVGKDDYGEYWVVIDPASGTGCWISRAGTSSQGIVDYLPNLLPPPTPMPRKPAAPGDLQAVLDNCGRAPDQYEWLPVVILTWEDLSDNEDAFQIYRHGQLVEYVDRGITRYRDAFTVKSNGEVDVTYSISSYSRAGGESEQVEIRLHFVCK